MTKRFAKSHCSWFFCHRMRATELVVTLILVFAILPSIANAEFRNGFWSDSILHVGRCTDAVNDSMHKGSRCLLGNGLKLLLDESLRLADEYGKRRFGRHFQVMRNLNYSRVSSKFGIEGDVDVVLPFAGAVSPAGSRRVSSFFFQQGVARSWDGSGSGHFRNDLRQGIVHRFWLSSAPGADILGVSAFHLLNVERGHRVLAPGIDYTGRWGVGSLRYFIPTTGWRPGRAGYEERALEGLEVGMRLRLTTTLRLNAVGYRWRAEDGSDRWDDGMRMGFDWRPHPWFRLGTDYDGIGRGKDTMTFQVALDVPFGGASESPPWEGLGVAVGGAGPASEELWRPVDDIGPIKVAKRKQGAAGLVEQARVRFLQDAVGSGEAVQLEVSLPAAAPDDIRIMVRLVPGSGANPAVAGEDFVDEPVETTIRQGTTSTTVSIPLIRNDGMEGPRSLGAAVTMAS